MDDQKQYMWTPTRKFDKRKIMKFLKEGILCAKQYTGLAEGAFEKGNMENSYMKLTTNAAADINSSN